MTSIGGAPAPSQLSISVEVTLTASGSLLSGDQLVSPTEEDLARQVPAQLAAQGARDRDRLEGELLPA